MAQLKIFLSNVEAYLSGKLHDSNLEESTTVQDDLQNRDPNKKGMCMLILTLFSMSCFLYDYGADIYLLIAYYNQKQFLWFTLTLTFVLVPSIIITVFSLIFYCTDHTIEFSRTGWFIRIFLHLFQLGPVVRCADVIIYKCKSKYAKERRLRDYYYKFMVREQADLGLLTVMGYSMESAPQMLLQLYILLTQSQVKYQLVIIQCVSCTIGLITLAWGWGSYQSALRKTDSKASKLKIIPRIIMTLWKILVLLPRFLAMALFISFYKLYILIVLGFHYLLMTVFVIRQKTTFCTEKPFTFQEIVFNFVMGAVHCVDFLNLNNKPDSSTRHRYIFYYSISFIEILTLMSFWFYDPLHNQSWIHNDSFNASTNVTMSFYYQRWPHSIRTMVFLMTITCFFCGIAMMLIYYYYFHPTQNIKICLKKAEQKPDPLITSGDNVTAEKVDNVTFNNTKTQNPEIILNIPN